MSASAHVARPLIYKYSTAVTRIESTDEPAPSILSSHFIIDIGVYSKRFLCLRPSASVPFFSLRMLLLHPFGRKMHEKKKEKDSHWVVCDDLGFFFLFSYPSDSGVKCGRRRIWRNSTGFCFFNFHIALSTFFFLCVRCMRPPTFLRMEQDFRGFCEAGPFLSLAFHSNVGRKCTKMRRIDKVKSVLIWCWIW